MTIKTILVCLNTDTNADELMTAACVIARQQNAHLIGLHAMEALLVFPAIAMHMPGIAYTEFNSSQIEQAEAVETIFQNKTAKEDFPSEWRRLRAEATTATDRIVESSRAADLVILSQEDPEADWSDQLHVQINAIRNSGRPVLVIPHGYQVSDIGKTILIGWSPTREATRAAHDILDLAQEGAEVHLLSITSGASQDQDVTITQNDVAASIARRGFRTTTIHRQRSASEISDDLQREAVEVGADVIATGAFGHSKFYDFVIGAVTRHLLKSMRMPVLFSK